jgi:hypothetical protein
MPAKVTLTVIGGALQGARYAFEERTTCIVGRGGDCHLRVPDDEDHRTVSRHHCLLDVNPPEVRVRDFGSRNGTWVNGVKIGQRPRGTATADAPTAVYPELDLRDGDEVRLGDTVFRVAIHVPAACPRCRAELPEGQRVCPACGAPREGEVGPPCCALCGADVSAERSPGRPGRYLCGACQTDPGGVGRRLLDLAEEGEPRLGALVGWRPKGELGRGKLGGVLLLERPGTAERAALKLLLPRVAADRRASSPR